MNRQALLVTLEPVTSVTDDIRALIGELDDELARDYPPEQRHGLKLDAIFEPHIRFFIAKSGGTAVGCGGIALFDGFAEVKRMYVRQVARGLGVADAIMKRLISEAKAAGRPLLKLETGNRAHAALGFYLRSGFGSCPPFEPYASKPPHTIATSIFLEKRL